MADLGPSRILSFSGTIGEFLDYIARWQLVSSVDNRNLTWADTYEWELTAAIARHPAGKRLGPIEGLHDSNTDGFWG